MIVAYSAIEAFNTGGFRLMMLTMFQMRPARPMAASYSRRKRPVASSGVTVRIRGIGERIFDQYYESICWAETPIVALMLSHKMREVAVSDSKSGLLSSIPGCS